MNEASVEEGDLLWEPSSEMVDRAMITKYLRWLEENRGLRFANYDALWHWSVTELEDFWATIWDFFEVKASRPYDEVLAERKMPGAKWFTNAELNYTDNIFRGLAPDEPALVFKSELYPLTEVSWGELERRVAAVAASLRDMGVVRGDRVVAFVPNIPETIIAFLATASIGAIWSCCSPDFGTGSVVDRFKQIAPKVLFAVDGYRYNGRDFSRLDAVEQIRQALPTLEHSVLIPYMDQGVDAFSLPSAVMWGNLLERQSELVCEQLPFDHPLWVVYSSGTTGLPKPLVHSQGGTLIELRKALSLHMDIHPGDRFFWFSTTGWIMWNLVQGALVCGAAAVLFDGSPVYPDPSTLYEFAAESKADFLGSGAPLLTASMQAGLEPGKSSDLSRVRGIGSTGAPLSPEGFKWVYDAVKQDVWLTSASGGTDIASAFLGGLPTLPVHAGELQCRCLGVKAEAFDDSGNSLIGEVGELVVTEPMPSMPLYLWNDVDGSRYHESYFDMYPGVWRHGDWVRITERGSGVILGRSDSTLKRMGVRMGSSDFYNVVEAMPEIAESLIVGADMADGSYWMPLFVVPSEGIEFNDELKDLIKERIRVAMSPRHLPDAILQIGEVPRTLNGKKLEVPVKKLLMGWDLERAVNVDSMMNAAAIEQFVDLAKRIEAGEADISRS